MYLHGDMGISLFNEPITEGATYVKPWKTIYQFTKHVSKLSASVHTLQLLKFGFH